MSSSSIPHAPTQLVQAVKREMHAAHAIVADPNCDPRSALVHVIGAWRALASADLADADLSPDDLKAWVVQQCTPLISTKDQNASLSALPVWLDSQAREPFVAGDENEEPAIVERSTVLGVLRLLHEVVATHHSPGKSPRARRILWARRVAAWAAVGMGFFLIATRPWELRRSGQWRGAYYPAEDFRGEPTVRRDRDIAFDWGLAPPMEDIPADRFGVRWDSCLVLDAETEAAFQLVSDDGSRLFIDGELVVDNWKPHKPTARGAWTKLPAGVHHLRVEYFEIEHEASIYLTATFDRKERPTSIPANLLKHPSSDMDAENPCASD
jgi:hypothetical protein